jgi:hypothetical protein
MKTKIATLFFAVAFSNVPAIWAQGGPFQTVCTNATLQGDFGFTITGTRPSSPGGPVETIVGVAMTHFDGNGNLTQTDNIHGSISGAPNPDRPGTGTYSIKSDCTGTMTLSSVGSPTLTLAIVVVDDGNEVRTAVTDPTAIVASGATAPQVIVMSNGRRVVSRAQAGESR